ncbi:MATE family efflux transporter [Halocatena salina]|nr:MATE family efflux transporter [Halocatena salina]
MLTQVLRTLMRTTDVIVAGFLSPAAVAAVGLADVYARLPARIGSGVGDGAIALSSQDTGRGAVGNRNEAVTQALLIGVLASVPFIVFGLFFNEWAIAVLGAEIDVVQSGALYLVIILLSSPARHTVLIAARAIQGTGDTRSPMIVRSGANAVNIVGTVVLAFGIGPLPELSVIGIAVATTSANYLEAMAFLVFIYSHWSQIEYVHPTDPIIGKQLILIGLPRTAEGLTELIAEFPFNAILLVFGTEVNAAYHIGRRMYQQIAAPLSRGYGIATNIIVGQGLGEGNPTEAYWDGSIIAMLGVITVGGLGFVLFGIAEQFVLLFTHDPMTVAYATGFARAYALSTVLIALYVVIAGALRGGSETRVPFLAKLSGTFIFLLGTTYLFGLRLGYGVVAAYAGIVADYAWRNVVLCFYYATGDWRERGTTMMTDRAGADDEHASTPDD